MEQRISLITLGSADVARAAAFWEAMGWRRADDRPGMAMFDLLGQSVAIYDRAALAADLGMEEGRLGTGLATYAYNVRARDEVAGVLDAAAAAGGRVVKPAHDAVWGGHLGFFADSDGHLWEVAFNPGAPLSPEGAFRWDGHGGDA